MEIKRDCILSGGKAYWHIPEESQPIWKDSKNEEVEMAIKSYFADATVTIQIKQFKCSNEEDEKNLDKPAITISLPERLQCCAIQVDLGAALEEAFKIQTIEEDDASMAITMLDDLQAKIEKMKTALIEAR